MLKHLSIKNYALIEQLDLGFNKGMTIITGETGAGKSILLGALRLVLGDRADIKSIKNTDEKCVVEATFDIAHLNLVSFFEEKDLEYEEETILRREILPSGKSRAFVNDVPTTLKVVSELSNYLIDVHSQFETSDLMTEKFQFEWVDAVAENQELLQNFNIELKTYKQKKSRLKEKEEQKVKFLQEADYTNFLFNELEQAQLEQISVEELEQEQYKLENAEEIALKLDASTKLLEEEQQGILVLMTELSQNAKIFSGFLGEENDIKSRIESARIELQDISNELQNKLEEIEVNPERLQEVQQTLNLINTLLQKHQVGSVEELIEIREDLNQKLLQDSYADDEIQQLKKECKALEKEINQKAEQLHEKRKSVIPQIEEEIITTLSSLGMENSQMEIALTPTETFSTYGKENIELLFSANKGMALKSVEKSVSGGERSRLMLAIKKSLAHYKSLPTLILDEIDTGVSGKIAEEMGTIMRKMSQNLQVITITHLPQVASKGNHHLKVQKTQTGESTHTQVAQLSEEERQNEIAQMLSGTEITPAALAQAKELLEKNK